MPPRSRRSETAKLILWLIISAAVAVLIFFFSAQSVSESTLLSRGFLRRLLLLLLGESPGSLIQRYDHLIRKAAHFSIYALLGFCLAGAYHHLKCVPTVPAAIVTAALYAVTDELHQSFVPGRGPLVTDVMIDTCGATLGALVMALILALLSRHARKT